MAVRMVRIVNDNGRTGLVPETHPRVVDGSLRLAPSQRSEQPANLSPAQGGQEPMPARNASTDAWREYARQQGLSRDEADAKSRDELVAYFTKE